tara:strand:+ start:161 stop:745 length:585 start_codon:yes stop_codon:yes gene_type:complete
MNPLPQSSEACRDKLLHLLASHAYRYGNFTLSSGKKSHHYVNCKPVTLSSMGLALTSNLLFDNVENDSIAIAGMTLGADPLVSGVAMSAALSGRELDALIIRKEAKGHGTSAWIEGPLPPKGSLITVLEDVVTTGGSSLKAVFLLREAGYLVKRVVTIVDRLEGGLKAMENEGLEMISLFSIEEISSKSNQILK